MRRMGRESSSGRSPSFRGENACQEGLSHSIIKEKVHHLALLQSEAPQSLSINPMKGLA